jgi:hypothetical protein
VAIACFKCGRELRNEGFITDLCVCGGETDKSVWRCASCNQSYYNEYYDCWDADRADDIWYEISESLFLQTQKRMCSCPQPERKFCKCPNHPFTIDLASSRRVEKPGS